MPPTVGFSDLLNFKKKGLQKNSMEQPEFEIQKWQAPVRVYEVHDCQGPDHILKLNEAFCPNVICVFYFR